jgi:hypothetical protein
MKRFLVVLTFFCLISTAHAIDIDMTGAVLTPTGPTTFHADHVTVPGMPGTYWADLAWDAANFTFVPTNYGAEAVPSGKTWSWPIHDYFGTSLFSITADPVNRVFYISYSWVSFQQLVCPTRFTTFLQADAAFQVSYTWTSSDFSGCDSLHEGQTVTAIVSELPSWFNFADTFIVETYMEGSVYCEPDGTYHK